MPSLKLDGFHLFNRTQKFSRGISGATDSIPNGCE
jgi:hypothetical protein